MTLREGKREGRLKRKPPGGYIRHHGDPRKWNMRKFVVWVSIMLFFCAVAACSANAPATMASVPPTVPDTPSSIPALSPDDFPDREFVGENDDFSVYLVNRAGGTDDAPTGEIIVCNKHTNRLIKMNGVFTVILGGGTIVSDDGKGNYVLLSVGTYTSRTAVILSLKDQKQAVKDFCTSSGQYGDHVFWDDHVIFNACDTFPNRPWGNGEAPSIAAINLETGAETVIAKSDLTHQYQIKIIEGNDLRYLETYVEDGEGWQTPEKQKTEEKIYDLSSLNAGE
jgi:hypothetical protein